MIDGVYLYYDDSTREVRRLEFKMLQPVVAREGDVYVARADFFDQQGRPVSMKLIVVMRGNHPQTLQAVASIAGGHAPPPCADSRAS
jgi:hypothetical protein